MMSPLFPARGGWLATVLFSIVLIAQTAIATPIGEAGSSGKALSALIKEWSQTLDRADKSLAKPDLDDERLDGLRAEIAALRLEAIAAADAAGPVAALIRDELKTLGDPPAADAPPESPALANQRKTITERLAVAEGSIKEAGLLISRADRVLAAAATLRRTRFTEKLLHQDRSPLELPVWQIALSELQERSLAATRSFEQWTRTDSFAEKGGWLGLKVGSALALALVLIWPLKRRLLHRFAPNPGDEPTQGRRLRVALSSGVIRAWLPSVALAAIYLALRNEALLSEPTLEVLKTTLAAAVFVYFVAAFARASLAPFHSDWRIVRIGDAGARRISAIVIVLALIFALDWVAESFAEQFGLSVELTIVQKFLSGLAITVLLLLLLRESIWRPRFRRLPPSERWLSLRTWRRIRSLLRLAVMSIPLSAMLGYVALSRVLATQMVLTPGLYAAVVLLRRVTAEAISFALSRQTLLGRRLRKALGLTEDGGDMLGFWLSELAGLLWIVAGLIGLAILWGAESDDLKVWLHDAFFGFKIGNVNLSLADVLLAVFSFVALLTLTRLLQRMLERRLFPRTRLDVGVRNSVRAAIGYGGFLLAATVSVSTIGLDLSNLAMIVGALSVGIGMGLQNVVNNFVSGLILLVERPIKSGDWVVVGEHQGYVRKISVRATEIITFDRASVFIPNSNLIATPVMNRTYADKVGRIVLPVSVAYGTDTTRVRELLLKIATHHADIIPIPAPTVLFRDFGERAIHIDIVAFVNDVDRVRAVTSDLCFEIDAVFRQEGIRMSPTQSEPPPAPPADALLHRAVTIPDVAKADDDS